jgi:hypothetical protein
MTWFSKNLSLCSGGFYEINGIGSFCYNFVNVLLCGFKLLIFNPLLIIPDERE